MSQSNSQKQKLPKPDALLAKLAALTKPKADAPEGFYPIAYWLDRLGKADTQAYAMLKAGVDAGLLDVGVYRAKDGAPPVKHWKEL